MANMLKGKDVIEAQHQLDYVIKRTADPLAKLLKSAVANAENNFHLLKSNLFIKIFIVDEGVKLKRFLPKGFGRVSPIQKKISRVKLVLAERVPGLKRQETKKHEEKISEHAAKEEKPKITEERKPEIKKELGKKSGTGFVKRFFRRKTI